MRLAAHTTGILDFEFEDGLAFLERVGVSAVEVACAGVFKDLRYGDPAGLAHDEVALRRWLDAYARHGQEICALSIHGEPLSADQTVADQYRHQFRDACALAEKIGVSRLSLVAGVCEGAPGDAHPAWIVGLPAEWPTPNEDVLRWQWEERLLPYWAEQAQVAIDHGCEAVLRDDGLGSGLQPGRAAASAQRDRRGGAMQLRPFASLLSRHRRL